LDCCYICSDLKKVYEKKLYGKLKLLDYENSENDDAIGGSAGYVGEPEQQCP
jgi:hypothetical protein